MMLQIFTVYDVKANAYLQPMYLNNEALAIRFVQTTLMDDTHMFSKFPTDFVLYHIGEWDNVTCKTTLLEQPLEVAPLNALIGKTHEQIKAVG